MSFASSAKIDAALDRLPQSYPGPGGLAAIIKDGAVIASRAWGYRDLSRRLPMTEATRLPICSISKQFTCGALLSLAPDLSVLDGRLAQILPKFQGKLPTVRNLCDMQSGLRDYWALTILQGAQPEGVFAESDAVPLLARMKTPHFAPGTQYSYSNGNFRILADLIEEKAGRGIGEVYRQFLFDPAGMETAVQHTDTSQPLDEVVGYEGNDANGHIPVVNRICWKGDAGVAASLADMIAYELWIDRSREDAASLYNRLSVAPTYADGSPAFYGLGLKRDLVAGRQATGHGGALRGFRAHRVHIADERLSVVVMFNHEADAHGAAIGLAELVLGYERPKPTRAVDPSWAGQWLDEEEGLLLRLDPVEKGMRLRYGPGGVLVQPGPEGSLTGPGVVLSRDGDALLMRRAQDHLSVRARPAPRVDSADGTELAGRYYSDEVEAEMEIEVRGGAVYAGFDGMLGKGPMERMHVVGPDLWVLATRRSMDAPAPGDWTVQLSRGADGKISGMTIGSWLARKVPYRRL